MGKKSSRRNQMNLNRLGKKQRNKIVKQRKRGKRERLGKIKNERQLRELKNPNMDQVKNNLIRSVERRRGNVRNVNNKNHQLMNQQMILKALHQEEFIPNQTTINTNNLKNVKNMTKQLDEILENSDILLEVLDVRDPNGCRCRQLERKFIQMNPDKKIILILNKVDLVPLEVTKMWKQNLSSEFPTIIFKANQQKQVSNLGVTHLFNKSLHERQDLTERLISSSKALGTQQLIELIKKYSKVNGIKHSVNVGVIGFPNVGKSSLINSLTKKKSVSVSAKPGHTKNLQYIQVDKQVTIIDCPGVFFSNEDEITLLLRNTIKIEDVGDLEGAVEAIVNKVQKHQLINLYQIQDFENFKHFLIQVAQKRGKIKKGGILDLQETCRLIINDWIQGKVKYFVLPQEISEFSR